MYAYSKGSGVPYFDTEEILPVRFVADVVGPVDMHEVAWASDPEWVGLKFVEEGADPLFAMLLTGALNETGAQPEGEELEECITLSWAAVSLTLWTKTRLPGVNDRICILRNYNFMSINLEGVTKSGRKF